MDSGTRYSHVPAMLNHSRGVRGCAVLDPGVTNCGSVTIATLVTGGNTTGGGVAEGGDPVLSNPVLVPVLFGAIFLFGVAGNALVVAVLAKNTSGKAHEGFTHLYLLNLSVADLSFLVLCVPFEATYYLLPRWIFGTFLCKFVHYAFHSSMIVSVFTLVALSVDRYLTVRSVRRSFLRTRRSVHVSVLSLWLCALLLAAPVPQHQTLVQVDALPLGPFCWECWDTLREQRVYRVLTFTLSYLLPLTVICVCYAKVLYHMNTRVHNMSRKWAKSKQKTTLTVFVVVAAFFISWLPHHIISLWVVFGTFPINDATFVFRIAAHCLTYTGSCANPAIYALCSLDVRAAAMRLLHLAPSPVELGEQGLGHDRRSTHL
uniref:galanin receptor type 1-like n=1 Tax=Myxine glutinosa TaxID=7769 RepID=UPI00358FDE79